MLRNLGSDLKLSAVADSVMEVSLLLPFIKLLSPDSFLDLMLVVYPDLLSVLILKELEIEEKPLFTDGLRLRDRGSEGIVKVSESAKTGVEKFAKNTENPNKIVDTTTIFTGFWQNLPLLELENGQK